jgi:hypothetical protein
MHSNQKKGPEVFLGAEGATGPEPPKEFLANIIADPGKVWCI